MNKKGYILMKYRWISQSRANCKWRCCGLQELLLGKKCFRKYTKNKIKIKNKKLQFRREGREKRKKREKRERVLLVYMLHLLR
jgi:hypothetical protein